MNYQEELSQNTWLQDIDDRVRGIYRNFTNKPKTSTLQLLMRAVFELGIECGKVEMRENYQMSKKQANSERVEELQGEIATLIKYGKLAYPDDDIAIAQRKRLKAYADNHGIKYNFTRYGKVIYAKIKRNVRDAESPKQGD